MTTEARKAEADRVEVVFYWALSQMGNSMAVDAVELFDQVPATRQAATATWWLTRLLRLLFGYREKATELAVAYYRLVRALRTGYAPTTSDESPGETISLEKLRDEFEAIVDEIDEATQGEPDFDGVVIEEPPLDIVVDDDEIELEEVADLDELIEELRNDAEEEASVVLDRKGIQDFLEKLDSLDEDAEDRDAKVIDFHERSAAKQAAAAARIMMNAARGLNYSLASTDQRVIGWVRYSQTGTPCGWCAMLLSREVLYKSKHGAQHQGKDQEENKFHDNCRCVAVPIFDMDQYDSSELFEDNRYYERLWKERIKGEFSGKEALSEWRKIIRQLNRTAGQEPEPDSQAQEAA